MSEITELRAMVETLRQQVAALAMGGNTRQGAATAVVTQSSHGFTVVGTPIRVTASGWVKSKADTVANSTVDAVVGGVLSADAFIAVFPGHLLLGLSGKSAGSRYFLDASTAGAVTTTAPAIAIPVYDAISASAAVLCASGGSSAATPTEDGAVWCSKSDLSGGEWDKTVDIGTSAAGGGTLIVYFASGKYVEISATGVVTVFQSSTSKVEINASSTVTITYANSNTVTFASADFVGTSKAVKLREIDVCDAGTAKKMLILASAAY